jgi:signal transduction histidine kinase
MDANPTASTGMQMARIVSAPRPAPVSLRRTIERCLGLLSRVACGRCVEVDYGEAAAAPVAVDEEAVERIVVNLVRNAVAALAEQGAAAQGGAGAGEVRQGLAAIRITVGALVNRVGDPRPWPFRRVRLTVDDCGIGMDPDQLERLLRGSPPRGGHGIGFRVVRELVATSGQIEWPATVAALAEGAGRRTNAASSLVRNGIPGEVQAGGQGLGEGRPGGPRGGGSC